MEAWFVIVTSLSLLRLMKTLAVESLAFGSCHKRREHNKHIVHVLCTIFHSH